MITFNGRFVGKPVTGVQRYATEIVAAIDAIAETDQALRGQLQIVVREGTQQSFHADNIKVKRSLWATGVIWTQFVLPLFSRGTLISLENLACLMISRQILCVHDLNTYMIPESYRLLFRIYYRFMLPASINRVRNVVTVSRWSADMIDRAGLYPASKISIAPNGHEHVHRWNATKSKYFLEGHFKRPFIFILGSSARHKNLKVIEEIATQIDGLGFDIVIAGFKDILFRSLGNVDRPPNIIPLGFVSDDDLAALYNRAFCFVFPSLMEGFGLPALEAMALGCPVITSNVCSLPEVCGDAVLYADPTIPQTWLRQITILSGDPILRAKLIQCGHSQAQKFSWKRSAEEYLRLA